jgi:molybdopterin synthase catalytic subunit
MVRLEPEALRPADELARFIASLAGDGAVVSFVGLARPADEAGQAVTGLFLDAYPGMTETSLEAIAADARARFAVSAVAIVHRSGAVAPGAPIVFAAAAALHRRAAFEAADYLMDRLKTDAAFWKREERADGAVWIEPRPSDRADRARWSDRCPE